MLWITRGLNLKRIFLYDVCTLEGGRPVRVLSVHPFVCLSVTDSIFSSELLWCDGSEQHEHSLETEGEEGRCVCQPARDIQVSWQVSGTSHHTTHASFSTSLVPRNPFGKILNFSERVSGHETTSLHLLEITGGYLSEHAGTKGCLDSWNVSINETILLVLY